MPKLLKEKDLGMQAKQYRCEMCRDYFAWRQILVDDEENLLCTDCIIKHTFAVYCPCGFFSTESGLALASSCPECRARLRATLPWMNPNSRPA
jgi:hypothetical protein